MSKIKKILVSQKAPSNMAPYTALTEKFGVCFEFRPFFLVEPLSAKEFRSQRVNIPDYSAVVFSSRHAIDAYFGLCEEIRFKVPETMKYFCTTEAVAMYLQKHIVYRKRKIFFGDGTPQSVIALMGPKHKGEKFLVASNNSEALCALMKGAGIDFTTAAVVKTVSQDLSSTNLSDFDMIVLYNPSDIKSLQENFPDFEQGDTKFVAYGKSIARAMEGAGYTIEVQAPTPEAPSVVKALELYLQEQA